MDLTLVSLVAILKVVWVNIILSGDNAVVIAMACRGLPARQRRMGILLGSAVAVVLRVVFTVLVVQLLSTPFLRIVGSGLLLWVAVKLLAEDGDGEASVKETDKLLHAVWTVAVADMVMSLDNVLAIAAVAQDNMAMLILGLLISIPLIVVGATVIMSLLARFPILVWAGAGLLGWVAGEMLDADPWLVERFGVATMSQLQHMLAAAGAALVLAIGWYARRQRAMGGSLQR